MEKALESLQFAHRLLVTLSVAIFVLVFSLNSKPGPYQKAYDELLTLRQTMPKLYKIREVAVENYYKKELLQFIREAAPDLDIDHLIIRADEDSRSAAPPTAPGGMPIQLESFYLYLAMAPVTDRRIVHQFDHRLFVEAFRALVKQKKINGSQALYIYAPRDSKLGNIIDGECKFAFVNENADVNQIYSLLAGEVGDIVPCNSSSIDFPKDAFDLLQTSGLIVSEGNRYIALPALRAVWDEVHGQDVQILQGILQRKLEAEKRDGESKLDLLGLAVKASVAAVVGPAALVSILFFLLGLILHISEIKSSDPDQVRFFPWFGMWRNFPGIFTSFLSVMVAPIAAGTMLIDIAYPNGLTRYITFSLFLLPAISISALIVIKSHQISRISSTAVDDTG